MTSKEALKYLLLDCEDSYTKYEEDYKFYLESEKCYNIVLKDLDTLEKLEKENKYLKTENVMLKTSCELIKKEEDKLKNELKTLKERYKHRAAISNELNEALNQYEKAFEILRDNVQITLYDKDSWVENYGINVKMILDYEIRFLTQEQYELLKEVLGNE